MRNSLSPYRPHGRPGDRGRGPRRRHRYGLGDLAKAYLLALAALVGGLAVGGVGLAFSAYVVAGVMLGRRLGEVFRPHVLRATLLSVAKDKLAFIVAWPIVTPQLLVLGAVNRHL